MELIIAELSRYIIVILFALYTFYSYRAFIGRAAGNNEGVFRAQRVLIVAHVISVFKSNKRHHYSIRKSFCIRIICRFSLSFILFSVFYENLSGVLQGNVKTNLE